MNDKIRELLKESGFCFWADEEWGPGAGKIDWNCDYEKEFDRFVELIVREHLGIWDLMDNGNKVEGYIEMEDYPKAIVEHFGLREINDDLSKAEEFENWCRESDDGNAADYIDCKTHPDAPHGFSRNASHNADRYVCECEHWEEPK
jgi:hypothetical protein